MVNSIQFRNTYFIDPKGKSKTWYRPFLITQVCRVGLKTRQNNFSHWLAQGWSPWLHHKITSLTNLHPTIEKNISKLFWLDVWRRLTLFCFESDKNNRLSRMFFIFSMSSIVALCCAFYAHIIERTAESDATLFVSTVKAVITTDSFPTIPDPWSCRTCHGTVERSYWRYTTQSIHWSGDRKNSVSLWSSC